MPRIASTFLIFMIAVPGAQALTATTHYGDSHTVGCYTQDDFGNEWSRQLVTTCDGIGGAGSSDIYQTFFQYQRFHAQDVVVALCMSNDASMGLSAADTALAVKHMHDKVTLPGGRFIFITPPPGNAGTLHGQTVTRDLLTRLQLVRFWMNYWGIEYVDVFETWIDNKWDLDDSLYADGVHLSNQGEIRVTQELVTYLPEPNSRQYLVVGLTLIWLRRRPPSLRPMARR